MNGIKGFMTVVYRDDGPLIHCGGSPAYRTIQVQLTDEQIAQIAPRRVGNNGGVDLYEDIDRCIIEPADKQEVAPQPKQAGPECPF